MLNVTNNTHRLHHVLSNPVQICLKPVFTAAAKLVLWSLLQDNPG